MAKLHSLLAVLVLIAVSVKAHGGSKDVDARDKGAQKALEFALQEYNKDSKDIYVNRVSKIHRVQKQTVTGMKYIIEVDIGRTECRKPTSNPEDCAFHTDPYISKTTFCHFEVISIPWLKQKEMKESKCY
ncbi:unnamed protein product [Staurois parvus]|uniref:Cystatin domain-containing protein n=1 Tax=Staurois parvus TaxID=386267 RepID=A0ABN9H2R5_9NEOB|nr:unnamed protein product [Staurois parvus]